MMLSEAIGSQIYYHGSIKKFAAFSYDYVGQGHDQEGPGFYLTTSIEDARGYGKHIAQVNASITRVVKTTGRISPKHVDWLLKSAPNLERVLEDWDEDIKAAYNKLRNSILTNTVSQHDGFQQIWYDVYYRSGNTKDFCKNMVKLGYDGVIIQKTGLQHFIGYNPDKLTIVGWDSYT